MVGPSDSLTHALQKLSEVDRGAIQGLQDMEVPPAYTANPTLSDDEDDLHDLDGWTEAPVTIHIDASISIEGTCNQIALPPHPSSRSLRVTGEGVRAIQGTPQDFLGSPTRHEPDQLNRDRAHQISDAVMQALKDSGTLAGTVTPMRKLDIHVDASISVRGERNVLTTNVPIRRNASGPTSSEAPSHLQTTQEAVTIGPGDGNSSSRVADLSEPEKSTRTADQNNRSDEIQRLGRTVTPEEDDHSPTATEVFKTSSTKRSRMPTMDGQEGGEERSKRATS